MYRLDAVVMCQLDAFWGSLLEEVARRASGVAAAVSGGAFSGVVAVCIRRAGMLQQAEDIAVMMVMGHDRHYGHQQRDP